MLLRPRDRGRAGVCVVQCGCCDPIDAQGGKAAVRVRRRTKRQERQRWQREVRQER